MERTSKRIFDTSVTFNELRFKQITAGGNCHFTCLVEGEHIWGFSEIPDAPSRHSFEARIALKRGWKYVIIFVTRHPRQGHTRSGIML